MAASASPSNGRSTDGRLTDGRVVRSGPGPTARGQKERVASVCPAVPFAREATRKATNTGRVRDLGTARSLPRCFGLSAFIPLAETVTLALF